MHLALPFVFALAVGVGVAAGDTTFPMYTPANLNLAVPDDLYNGTLASMAASNLVIAGPSGGLITRVDVDVRMNHSWIGDLVIKLRGPNNALVTLISRPGYAETVDNGTNAFGDFGDSSDLLATFPIVYRQNGASSAETMGNTIANTQAVCRDDVRCDYVPNNGAAAAGNLTAFNGINPSGTWTLFIGDSEIGELGMLQQWGSIITVAGACPADVNGDHSVSVNDMLAVLTTWGACPACPPTHCPSDIAPIGSPTGNCQIDVNDLLLVITNSGACP